MWFIVKKGQDCSFEGSSGFHLGRSLCHRNRHTQWPKWTCLEIEGGTQRLKLPGVGPIWLCNLTGELRICSPNRVLHLVFHQHTHYWVRWYHCVAWGICINISHSWMSLFWGLRLSLSLRMSTVVWKRYLARCFWIVEIEREIRVLLLHFGDTSRLWGRGKIWFQIAIRQISWLLWN